METMDLKELLCRKYEMKIEPADYDRLVHTMEMYNVGEVNFHIEAYKDLHTFVNNIYTLSDLKFNRMRSKFGIEDVIYTLKPIITGSSIGVKTVYPKLAELTRTRVPDIEWFNDKEENMVLIHRISLDVTKDDRISDEQFILAIYNPDLDIRGGIIFQRDIEVKKEDETDGEK